MDAGRATGCPRGLSAEWPTIIGLSRTPGTLAFRRGYVDVPAASNGGSHGELTLMLKAVQGPVNLEHPSHPPGCYPVWCDAANRLPRRNR